MNWLESIKRWFGEASAGEPVAECDRVIRELEGGVAELRRALAEAARARSAADRGLAALLEDGARWEAAARSAVRAGREADARRLLERRLASEAEAADWRDEIDAREASVAAARRRLREMEDLIQQARARRETAVARQQLRAAEARLEMRPPDGSGGIGGVPPVIRGLDRIEQALMNGICLWPEAAGGGEDDPAANPFSPRDGTREGADAGGTPENRTAPPGRRRPANESEVDARVDALLEEARARRAAAARAHDRLALDELDRLLDGLPR